MKYPALLCLSVMLNLYACTDNSDTEQQHKDHVWKGQTDALNKAAAVEGIIQESADIQQGQIQDETR